MSSRYYGQGRDRVHRAREPDEVDMADYPCFLYHTDGGPPTNLLTSACRDMQRLLKRRISSGRGIACGR